MEESWNLVCEKIQQAAIDRDDIMRASRYVCGQVPQIPERQLVRKLIGSP